MRKLFKSFKRNILIILVLLVVVLAAVSAHFYKKAKTNPDAVSQAEVKSLVRAVGKLIVLPEGEIPTVATVSDPQLLQNQEFFIDAKKGDKVLIYSIARKAILYDPKIDKVITIAPLNVETAGNSTPATPN